MNLTKPQKLIYDMDRFAGGAISVICGSMLVKGEQDLDKLKWAVNEIYRLNDALRIRIRQEDGQASQHISDYAQREVEVLRFDSKAELDAYAEEYAKTPIDLYGHLCLISIVLLPGQYGVLVKFHHMVGDAWTIALIGTQFNKLLNGETVESFSYADYVESEQAYLQSSRYEKDRDFFLEQFRKCDEVTYLNEKQSDTRNACRRTFVVDSQQTKQIVDYAKENGTSAFVLFTAALATYMSRIKMNAEKFYIGTAVLNRSGVKEKNTMGMFVNTVPMLMELDNSKSFAENLDGLQKTAFSIFRHQKHNYGDVLAAIRKENGFSETLYDVMISYQNAAIMGADVETTWYFSGSQNESLQIHIDDRDSEGIFRIHYDYLTDKFTADEIDMLHRHICTLLFDAIQNSEKKLPELELLTAVEKQKLLYDFNDTAADYPQDKCVHQLFEERVLKTPDKTAVIACDKTLTYAQLNEEANRIAHALIEQGVGVGNIVAIKLSRKSYLFSAMLAVLKAGAAYMPIDPNYPANRIEYMLTESNAKFCIDEANISQLLSNESAFDLDIEIDRNSMFCALHTSGSTGKPKLSLLRQDSMLNFISANQRFWEDVDTIVSATVVTFDAFAMESVLSVAQGKQVVLASEDEIFNQSMFEALFFHSEHNMFFSTPTKLEHYIQSCANSAFLQRVKCFVVGGEVFSGHLLRALKKAAPQSNVYNIYGPTETTICISTAQIDLTMYQEIKQREIKDLTAVSAQEKQMLLQEFVGPEMDYPKDCCVHHLFEAIAARSPEKEAVVACDTTLTYGELNVLANRIANTLLEMGVKQNDIVAFALPRTSMLIAVMFGILKSGAAYMPLDPDYPQERIDGLLSDARAKFFITRNNVDQFLSDDIHTPDITVTQDDYYCALHTSGSTGRPKLTVLTHRGIMNFMFANQRFYEGIDATVSAAVATFDIFAQDTVISIASGVKTILCSQEEIYDQSKFEQVFSLVSRALFFATPTKLKNYIAQSRTKEFLKHIGVFVVGGEVFPDDLYKLLMEHTRSQTCYNGYGPAEASIGVTYHKLLPPIDPPKPRFV